MNIDRSLVNPFKEFTTAEYAANWEDLKRQGEVGRTMLEGNTRCMILREHFPRRSSECVEVFLSDKDLLNMIVGEFYYHLKLLSTIPEDKK